MQFRNVSFLESGQDFPKAWRRVYSNSRTETGVCVCVWYMHEFLEKHQSNPPNQIELPALWLIIKLHAAHSCSKFAFVFLFMA